ncbi:S8 family serine peptidase [Paenisporosarcina sp. FSL H8-0542]|uniref:S8 family peptidase n=1 Tax=Paenisporosarcina sp. FSL H8-0542 TaxID=2921401 RepID=UPI00315A2662
MKYIGSIALSALLLFGSLPNHEVVAETTHHILVKVNDSQKDLLDNYKILREFDTIPVFELEVTSSQLNELKMDSSNVQILPDFDYQISADSVPVSFKQLKVTPTQVTPYTGKGVKVGILDTGIDTEHSDLFVRGGFCSLEVKCPQSVSYDDDNGHGTHVAGTIAALKNNAGIQGVAPNVELFAIKSLNRNGGGSTASLVAGVEWAIKNDIDILNISVTTNGDDPALRMVLDKAYQSGMVLVAAAGNEGESLQKDSVQYPAKYDSVIGVAAITATNEKLLESSSGPEVEIAAPGSSIVSTYPRNLDTTDGLKNGYFSQSGTSMAAPHVTGVLALYKERFPNASNVKLRQMLQVTATDLGAVGRDETFGYGVATYEPIITELPFLESKVANGQILFTLQNKDAVSSWKLTENGTTLKEVTGSKWELYRPAGTYSFNFTFVMKNGAAVTEKVNVTLKNPAFTDLNQSQWYSSHVSYLFFKEQMNGYKDGSFKPTKEITRAEAVALLGRAKDLNGEERVTSFKDVGSGNFASGYIQSALEEGILSGFPDGTFKPNQAVTRAEMAILIQNAFMFPSDPNKGLHFSDMNTGMASYEAIQALVQQGIAKGISTTQFQPHAKMTRSTYSVFLARAQKPTVFK